MGNFLHVIGEKAFTYRWWVIGGWVAILAFLGVLASQNYKTPSDAISIPGTEAQLALDRFGELFPDAGKGTGRVVFEAKGDGSITDNKAAIETILSDIKTVDGVSQIISPFQLDNMISEDGTIAYATISLEEGSDAIDEATISGIEKAVNEGRSDALTVEMGGDVISHVPSEILGIGEVAGVAVALIVLAITLGSLVAAGLPIVIALVTVAGGSAGLFALSHVVDITSTTPVLAIMLGLAVGIDYSLFIVNKYRNNLLHGYSLKDASSNAVATAGSAVVFAALTVVIALAALSVVGIPFMTSMGLAAAATVALAALVAITLLPALFHLTGNRIFTGKTRQAIAKAQKKGPKDDHTVQKNTLWYKLGAFIVRRPWVVLCSSVLIVGAMALPIQSLNLGLPTDEYAATDTTQRKAYDILERGFGAGFNAPLLIVAEDVEPVTDADKKALRESAEAEFKAQVAAETKKQTAAFEQQLSQARSETEVLALQQEARKQQAEGEAKQKAARKEMETQLATFQDLYHLNTIAETLSERQDVESATPLLVTEDTTKGILQVIPTAGPSDTETLDLISTLRSRDTVKEVTDNQDTTFAITGSTALQIDINQKLTQALPEYLLVVVGLSFVLLLLVFRSVLVPLKATLGFLLSVGAMFGALVMVFQWGWLGIAEAPGPIVSFIPIIAIGVLFGLAMDYEFFLVSSIHEEYERSEKAKQAIVNGYSTGSRVVVAAAIIMVAVFAGFVTNHDATIQAIGFGLAVGVFVDAFIVRLLIVPAVMSLLGDSAWWLPSWLKKRLPKISIEG